GATSGQLTYYKPGMGACGNWNGEGDAIVAISHIVYDEGNRDGNPNNNAHCGRQIKITSVHGLPADQVVTVQDRCKCEGCAAGDLDVPEQLFQTFAPSSAGRIPVEWYW
ncbi:hypothetical protein BT63DRAFT_364730, partial [Microthyrium microscopicum]